MPKAARTLEIANRQRRGRPRKEAIRALLDHLLDAEGEARGVEIAFLGEPAMRKLHRTWMGEDRATDVLSFPSGPAPVRSGEAYPAGEVIVCVPYCERAARARGRELHDEIARMLIHGTLHVLGYDHGTATQRSRMKPRERRYLAWYRRQDLRVIEAS
jgi:rRNA maturation RNase YbeY